MTRPRSASVRLLLILFLGAVLLSASPSPGLGADPEPWIDPNQTYWFEPGPGWPEGWTPPPEPTEIPPRVVAAYEEYRDSTGPEEVKPERLEMRVLRPLPEWTKEYPYYWMDAGFQCGKTAYVYMYPAPDTALILRTFGKSYAVAFAGVSGKHCLFTPVSMISLNEGPTPEELAQRELQSLRNESIGKARPRGLEDCRQNRTNGTLQNIYVCFNSGDASAKFDVPAYLDTAASRVRVPIRFVSEMMGAEVTWHPERQQVNIHLPAMSWDVVQPSPLPGHTIDEIWEADAYVLDLSAFKWVMNRVSTPERSIVLTIGQDTAMVDGKAVKIDAPPIIKGDRTMVPLRFVAQSLGAKVYWVGRDPIFRTDNDTLGGTYQVHIYTPFWPYFAYPDWFLENRAVKQ